MFEIVGREEQVFEQWEQGVTLSNPCMKAGDEVVFRNSSGATYVMIAGASGVEVPNKLLQMCCNILVDLEQGNDRHTECRTTFTVNPAQKPDGYKCVDNSVPDNRISFNDLKDKPFYEEKAVLFEGKVEFSGTSTGVEQRTIPQLIPFSVGDTVKVTWNGVEYECIAFDSVAMGGPGSAAVGNPFLLTGVNTGEPFGIGTSPESGVTVVFSYTKITEASIKIEGTKVKTIDPKFIPAGVGGGVVIVQDSAMASGAMPASMAGPTATMNAAQIAEAVFAGKAVYVIDPIEGALFPFEMGYRFGELRSGVMMADSLPDPYAQFGYIDEYGAHHIIKVYMDGSYEYISHQFQVAESQ
jgi:hypothetical protein